MLQDFEHVLDHFLDTTHFRFNKYLNRLKLKSTLIVCSPYFLDSHGGIHSTSCPVKDS